MRLSFKMGTAEAGTFNEAVAASRWSELRVVAGLLNGKPQLLSRYHTSPLKIAKAFPLEFGAARQLAIVQMDGSPGLLEGDRYLFEWVVEENTWLYVTNQAYTRIHPCAGGDSRIKQRLILGAHALLEWIPEPLMLFRDARFHMDTELELEEGSICVLCDIVCPGRLSRGEAFDYHLYDAKLSVKYKGELIYYQRQRWEPAVLPIESAGCFGGYTHIGALSLFSDRITEKLAAGLREFMNALSDTPTGLIWGVAHTVRSGLVVQAAGDAAWKLQLLLLKAWDYVRKELLELPPLRLLKEAWMT